MVYKVYYLYRRNLIGDSSGMIAPLMPRIDETVSFIIPGYRDTQTLKVVDIRHEISQNSHVVFIELELI